MPGTFAERLAAIDVEMSRYLDDLEVLLADPPGPVRLDTDGHLHLSPLTAEVVDPAVMAEGSGRGLAPGGASDRAAQRSTGRPGSPPTSPTLAAPAPACPSWSTAATCTPPSSRWPATSVPPAWTSSPASPSTPSTGPSSGTSGRRPSWTPTPPSSTPTTATRWPQPGAAAPCRPPTACGCQCEASRSPGRALSRYFIHEGLTSYTHISDQHSTYGTQIIVSTERDATFALDEILGNTTELPIIEHTTDSHGQTPGHLRPVRPDRLPPLPPHRHAHRETALAAPPRRPLPAMAPGRAPAQPPHPGRPHRRALGRPGPDRRVAQTGPRLGCTPHRKLQAGSRQYPLAKALLEYGKLLRTLHALRWFTDEAFRRRIGRQLNLGEATNDLRRFIFYANRGAVRHPHHDDQTTQALCDTLVVNACILSTPGYLQDAIDAPNGPTATRSATTPSPALAPPASKPSTPTGP